MITRAIHCGVSRPRPRLPFLRIATAAAALTLGWGSAAAGSMEGEWTNDLAKCGTRTFDNIHVRSDGFNFDENGCTFKGGVKESDNHWIMKAGCAEGAEEAPEHIWEFRRIAGKLRVTTDGQNHDYAMKCNAAESPSLSDENSGNDGKARTYWNHNGSVLYLVAEGARRRFYYSQPRPIMIEAGARADSLLFDGNSLGDSYVGTAFIFHASCGQYPYTVSGPILDDNRRVVLRGEAPLVNDNCVVYSHRDDVLTFTLAPGQ